MSSILENILTLPHLKVLSRSLSKGVIVFVCHTERRPLACIRCATRCETIYDHRKVTIRDQKIRHLPVKLEVWKKRYFCPKCKKPRTEPIHGVLPGRRTTQRFRRWVKELCTLYSNLESVCNEALVSRDFAYRAFYEQLDLEFRKRKNPWPKSIGIDEHSFRKRPGYGGTEFATMIVAHPLKRAIEVVEGKTTAALEHQLGYIPQRENVDWATIDLCDPFKKFIRSFFPNAKIVADPFHVIRLLNNDLNQARKKVTGDRRTHFARRLLLRSRKNLSYAEKHDLQVFLDHHPEIEEIYHWKERLMGFYRIRGYERAKMNLLFMLDEMASSRSKSILRLRKTLQKWHSEILNHFICRLTNARVEGFNNVAKTIKKQAYGFRSFKNYRLRVLNACF